MWNSAVRPGSVVYNKGEELATLPAVGHVEIKTVSFNFHTVFRIFSTL